MFLPDARAAYERALASVAVLLSAAGALSAALFVEHVLGVLPCHLCLIQRWPYYVGILLAAAALGTAHKGRRPSEAFLMAAAGVFLVGAGLGIHHSGVEAGLWAGPTGCTGGAGPMPGSAQSFFEGLKGAPPAVACDKVGFRLLGLTLANWNVAASLAIAAMAIAGSVPAWRGRLMQRVGLVRAA